MSDTQARDVDLLARGRVLVPVDAEAPVTDGSDDVYLLAEGEVVAHVLTPLGPHAVGVVRAPSFLSLHGALTGAFDLCRYDPLPGSAMYVFSGVEARQHLFDPAPAGAAFRRLALASVTTALREVNAALVRFFDDVVPDPSWKPRPAPSGPTLT